MIRSEQQSGSNEMPDTKLIKQIERFESMKVGLRPILKKKIKLKIFRQRFDELIAKLKRMQQYPNSQEDLTEREKRMIRHVLSGELLS